MRVVSSEWGRGGDEQVATQARGPRPPELMSAERALELIQTLVQITESTGASLDLRHVALVLDLDINTVRWYWLHHVYDGTWGNQDQEEL